MAHFLIYQSPSDLSQDEPMGRLSLANETLANITRVPRHYNLLQSLREKVPVSI